MDRSSCLVLGTLGAVAAVTVAVAAVSGGAGAGGGVVAAAGEFWVEGRGSK